jgi:GPH family glycoside/pentoside/hexuronide:cation symporter
MENNELSMRISLREKLAYGLGDVASNVVWSAAGAFLTYYYTNVVGIAAAAAGTIMLISRIFDGVSDIIMGGIIDKTKSKFGKARPWLLWMAGPFALAAFLLFAVPRNWSDTAKVIYAFITYNLMSTVVYTAINLPYGVMNAMMTDNLKDRTQLNIFRMMGALTMGIAANMSVVPLVKVFGNGNETDPRGWTLTFIMLGIIAACLFLLCFFGTKERIKSEPKQKSG